MLWVEYQLWSLRGMWLRFSSMTAEWVVTASVGGRLTTAESFLPLVTIAHATLTREINGSDPMTHSEFGGRMKP